MTKLSIHINLIRKEYYVKYSAEKKREVRRKPYET